jgi:2-phosphosulfolactate phosphatase
MFDVRFEWGLQGLVARSTGADVIVIVDVLSFSTAVEVCISRRSVVYPFAWKDDRAVAFAAEKKAILAASRSEMSHVRPFSLSPTSLLALPEGSNVVLPSPNGATISIAAAKTGAAVIAGGLRNATAVAQAAAARGKTILVIAAGERWPDESLRPALEDLLGAAAILAALPRRGMSPEAETTLMALDRTTLRRRILECESSRELLARGHEADVEASTALDASTAVPILVEGAYRAA